MLLVCTIAPIGWLDIIYFYLFTKWLSCRSGWLAGGSCTRVTRPLLCICSTITVPAGSLQRAATARTADGKTGPNVRRHSLDRLYASMVKLYKQSPSAATISFQGNM